MELRHSYSKTQLEEAVKFIARYNEYFQGKTDYIKEQIMNAMHDMIKDPDLVFNGTMGFVILADREFEGIDNDINTVRFEILVNPALCMDVDDDDYIEEITDV